MNHENTVSIYLEASLRQRAENGAHNFINLMAEILEKALFRVSFHDISKIDAHVGGYSLSHMKAPPDQDGLVFRRVYKYPFWQIERTSERWHWDVAGAQFDPDIHAPDAARFYAFWQRRLFADAPQQTRRDGFVYVPLQGRLTQHRSFQSCSPIEMIEHCLEYEPRRKIIATLHPNEHYSTRELATLDTLKSKHARLSVGTGNMVGHLQHCDYIVTENSSAAFMGNFFGKPALLFGKIDFHHIAERADMENLEESFSNAAQASPCYDKYIWWFWQHQSINAGRGDAGDKIAARFKRFGWAVR